MASPSSRAAIRSTRERLPFATVCLCLLVLTALLGGNAPSAGAEEACPNQALREEQHSTFLPDCRAFELVSPQDKNGGDVMRDSVRTRAAANGNAVQFASNSAFAEPHGTGIATDYISERESAPGTQGWATHAITPTQDPLAVPEVVFGTFDPRYMGEFSPDLNRGIFLAKSNIGSEGADVAKISKLYLRDDLLSGGEGHYTLLTDCPACGTEPLESPGPHLQPAFTGASTDFGHIAFESTFNLTGETSGELSKLYEWDQGTLRLAGMVPPGSDTECGPVPLDPCQPAESSAAGQGADPNTLEVHRAYTTNTVSSDGSRIAFTSPVGSGSEGTSESNLYLRENGATTVQLNASERATPEPPGPATFWAATPDLSKVFFTSSTPLTDEAGGGLYVYDASKQASDPHNLRLITSGQIEGVIGVSESGDYVYFVSAEQLIPGGPTGCDPVFPCVFVWHEGTLHEVSQINFAIEENDAFLGLEPVSKPKRARLSPDGTDLVFISEGTASEQPPYDHGNACQGVAPSALLQFFDGSTPACTEVYLYDAAANGGEGKLSCVSCDPSGHHTAATDGDFTVTGEAALSTYHLTHPLSDDGRYVFFDTGEALVPQDNNGETYDVYRYDSQTEAVSLISSGTSPDNSYFLDASADGRDVFFRTAQQLVDWDHDELSDVYDARVEGGFPEPPPTAICEGESCQGSQARVPHATTPPTTGSGPGNPRPNRRCRGRKVRRHGRCVAKKHHHVRADHHRRAAR